MALSLSLATDETVDQVCESLLPMIKSGLAHGAGDRRTLDDFLGEVKAGDIRIMVIHGGPDIVAGVFFSVLRHPSRKIVFVEMLAGSAMDSWIQMQTALEKYRQQIGADGVEASCRPGLAKYLAEHGWQQKAILMEMSR